MKKNFSLHRQLKTDSFEVGELTLCDVRLMNHSDVLWLLLIPRIPDVTELLELSTAQQHQLIQEITHASAILKQHFLCDKINIGSLGNVVPQLHVHVMARRREDRDWPKPVWGNPTIPYSDTQLTQLITQLQQYLFGQ